VIIFATQPYISNGIGLFALKSNYKLKNFIIMKTQQYFLKDKTNDSEPFIYQNSKGEFKQAQSRKIGADLEVTSGKAKIRLKNIDAANVPALRYEELPSDKWEELYAIDPTNLNITEATITRTATGNTLYKCKDYDYTSQNCFIWATS